MSKRGKERRKIVLKDRGKKRQIRQRTLAFLWTDKNDRQTNWQTHSHNIRTHRHKDSKVKTGHKGRETDK